MAFVRIEVDVLVAKVHSPYDPTRVEVIKTIPGRFWEKAGHFWTVPSGEVPALKAALEAFGDHVQIIGAAPTAPSAAETDAIITRLERDKQRLQQEIIRLKNAQAASTQNWAEQLLGRLGVEQGDKAFKALSRVLHPDVGGDTVLMQQLNAARDLVNRVR